MVPYCQKEVGSRYPTLKHVALGSYKQEHFITTVKSVAPTTEEETSASLLQCAPWAEAIAFVYCNMPKDKARSEIKLLEVGCGTANNLWFAARQGFDVYGIDSSRSAVERSRKLFEKDGLNGDLRVGDFTKLPHQDSQFDLVIERHALSCGGTAAMKDALREIHRVLKGGGKFLFTPFADTHPGFKNGRKGEDVILGAGGDSPIPLGRLRFLSHDEIDEFLPRDKWNVLALNLVQVRDMLDHSSSTISAHWHVVAAKR